MNCVTLHLVGNISKECTYDAGPLNVKNIYSLVILIELYK